MFACTSSAPFASSTQARAAQALCSEPLHLMLVQTPNLTQRGRDWLERMKVGPFDGVALERLIRWEKLSLG